MIVLELKPFDLQAALSGAAVVTRTGLAVLGVEIINEDANALYPIQAYVEGQVDPIKFAGDGRFHYYPKNTINDLDLFML